MGRLTLSEAQKKAAEKYQKANYDRVSILLPQGTKERILGTGNSVNGFIKQAVEEKLQQLGK